MTFTDSIEAIVSTNSNGLLAKHVSWQRTPLGLVCRVINGFPFPSDRFSTERGTPLIRIRDVLAGWTDTRFDGEYEPQYIVSRGELLVGMDGDFNCAPWRGEPALLNQRVCKVVPDERHYSARFLKYTIQGYLSAINAHTPSMTVKHLSSRTLADCPLPLPPRGEQERVADSLDEMLGDLDSAAAALERVQRNLKRYRATVLQAAVEGRLVPTEAELARADGRDYEPASELLKRILAERRHRWEEAELARLKAAGKAPKDDKWKGKYEEPVAVDAASLPGLPGGWCWVSMASLCETNPQNGLYVPQTEYGDGTPILRIDDYQVDWSRRAEELQRVLIPAADAAKYRLREGDLIINRVNSPSHLGKALVVRAKHAPAIFESNMMRIRINDSVVPAFVEKYVNSAAGKRRLTQNAKWAVNQASINQQDVVSTPVPLAPFVEQERIVDEVERLLSLCDEALAGASKAHADAARLRQSILKWAFEGKLVDQDPNDEPASVLLDRIRAERAAQGPADPRRGAKKRRPAHQRNS